MRKIVVFFLAFLFFTVLSSFVIHAQENISYENINPDKGFEYRLKRLEEKISLFLKFSKESKLAYKENLLDKRLAELKYVIDNKKENYLETSSQRYETLVEELMNEKATKSFDNHMEILKKLASKFDGKSAEYRFVMNDVNSLKNYLATFKK